jgi:hypothetical protein
VIKHVVAVCPPRPQWVAMHYAQTAPLAAAAADNSHPLASASSSK